MRLQKLIVAAALTAAIAPAQAAIEYFQQSSLTSTTQLYTDAIGGGIGDVVTIGGNASGRSDDGYSSAISLGYTFTFMGTDYTSFYANNNGNISFTSGNSGYNPQGPIGASIPTISIWFGDVDTRNLLSGVLHIRQDIANETILTWDHVGYYQSNGDKLNTFQMIIRGSDYAVPTGQGTIGFYWLDMPWEATNTSQTAAVGFGDGAGNGVVLEGSNTAGLNDIVTNRKAWFNVNLDPVELPEPATLALMAFGLLGLGMSRRRKAV